MAGEGEEGEDVGLLSQAALQWKSMKIGWGVESGLLDYILLITAVLDEGLELKVENKLCILAWIGSLHLVCTAQRAPLLNLSSTLYRNGAWAEVPCRYGD